jgi:hypothetical protein
VKTQLLYRAQHRLKGNSIRGTDLKKAEFESVFPGPRQHAVKAYKGRESKFPYFFYLSWRGNFHAAAASTARYPLNKCRLGFIAGLIITLSSSSSSVKGHALTDLFRPRQIASSKIFQVVFVHLVYISELFLASCCSFLEHVAYHDNGLKIPCHLLGTDRRSSRKCWETEDSITKYVIKYGGTRFLQTLRAYLPDYTASHLRRNYRAQSPPKDRQTT